MWLYNSLVTLIGLAPWSCTCIVVIKVISQLSRLLAFLLPLKALLVAGAGKLPRYLDWSIFGGQPAAAVLFMSGVAAFTYFVHLRLEKRASNLVVDLAGRIPVATGLIILSASQIQKKQLFTSRLIDVCVAGVMLALMWFGLPLLQWQIGLAFWLLCIIAVACLVVYWKNSVSFRSLIKADAVAFVGLFSSLLFFSGFGLLLTMLLTGVVNGIIVAIVSMVMVRVFAAQLIVIVSRTQGLLRNRVLVDQFISRRLAPMAANHSESISVEQILEQELGSGRKLRARSWMRSTSAGIGAVLCNMSLPKSEQPCLLKIYEENRTASSKWEELLAEKHVQLGLGLYQIAQGDDSSGNWRLLEMPSADKKESLDYSTLAQIFCAQLLALTPDAQLVSMYDDKLGSLAARLASAKPSRLAIKSMNDERLASIENQWPSIIQYLQSYPLQYVLKVSRDVIVEDEKSSLVRHFFCENWCVGPIGSVFDTSNLGVDWELALNSARVNRSELNEFSTLDLELSRSLSRYDSAMTQKRWGLAWAELDVIDSAWRALQQ